MFTKPLVSSFFSLTLIVIMLNSLFLVSETERAIMLKFGEVISFDIKPGLHFKIPIIHSVKKFDARIITLDAQPKRYLTLEKKALIVDSYVKWRIKNVATFYTATSGNEILASRLLSSRADTGLRNQFGQRTLNEVVSGKRDELMQVLLNELNQVTINDIGIEIIDVRVKRIDLPTEVSQSVYDRMRTEREREARELRSMGKERAEGIRADADRQQIIIAANAYRSAELIRGDGDAKSTAIYSNAFTKDPEFYSFSRSLVAYKKTFAKENDLILLSPQSNFFKYLKNPIKQ